MTIYHNQPYHLDGGGEDTRASKGFFGPTEGFLAGALALLLIPIGVAEGTLELNWFEGTEKEKTKKVN